MEKYSSYKDSGFAWMGQIPSHWETRRFRFLLAENSLQNTDLKERKQLQFKYGDIVPKVNQSEDKDVLDTIKKYTVVAPGDIMINGLNLNYDFISQRVAQVQEPGVITSAYVSLRPLEGANSKYYTYYMKAMDAQKMFHGMGSGVRLTLSYDNLKNLFFPYPSPEEQEAIVAYLDAATAKIDEAIAQQQRMIDLLNERKKIIISNAVSKGLDPNAKLKDTGIDWMGQIPEHWEVCRIKAIGKSEHGISYSPSDITDESGVIVLRASNIQGGKLCFDDNVYIKRSQASKFLKKDDILICATNGSLSLVGKNAIIDKSDYYSYGTFMLALRTGQNQNFIRYQLGRVVDNYRGLFATTTINQITQQVLGDMRITIPPKNEQEQIAMYLDGTTSRIDNAIFQQTIIINLLQERKQIIINDVVTGKVKVV